MSVPERVCLKVKALNVSVAGIKAANWIEENFGTNLTVRDYFAAVELWKTETPEGRAFCRVTGY